MRLLQGFSFSVCRKENELSFSPSSPFSPLFLATFISWPVDGSVRAHWFLFLFLFFCVLCVFVFFILQYVQTKGPFY